MLIPAGSYYIGDPANFLKKTHLNVWEEADYEPGIYFNNLMFVYYTVQGEGIYSDSDATEYLVKTGTIGLIEKSLCLRSVDTYGIGRLINSNGQPITFTQTEDGILTISYGDIVIDIDTSIADSEEYD